jgi:choline-glycine betaine transporter
MKTKKIKNIIALVSLISLPILALAQIQKEDLPKTSFRDISNIVDLLNKLINWIFTILMGVAIIFILMAAFSYLGSAGAPEKVQEAQNKLIYAAVAIGIGLIAQGVRFIVENLIK